MLAVVCMCSAEILWASGAKDLDGAKARVFESICDLLQDSNPENGVQLEMQRDSYEEPILVARSDVLKNPQIYKIMDEARAIEFTGSAKGENENE